MRMFASPGKRVDMQMPALCFLSLWLMGCDATRDALLALRIHINTVGNEWVSH